MVYVGIIMILLILVAGLLFLISDIKNKNDNFNRHVISFQDGYDVSNLPLAQLKINGKYEWFLIDSGASINLIKESYFNSLSKQPEKFQNQNEIYTGNNNLKSEYCVMSLKYKSTKFDNEVFNIAQLNVFDDKKEDYKRDIIGIVGSPLFEKYKWTICFDKMCIYINK